MRRRLAILTLKDDLHAYIVRDHLEKHFATSASIVEVDNLVGKNSFNWSNTSASPCVPSLDGALNVDAIDLVWWRRSRADQLASTGFDDPAASDLINQDWRGALRAILLNKKDIQWVSDPVATEAASFKLSQLEIAHRCGFRVPKTLISNDPSAVRDFVSSFKDGVVVKAVSGTRHKLLITSVVKTDELPADSAISCSPTIYQEHIRGTRHLRINQFGKKTFSFMISSTALDWRPKLNKTIEYHPVDTDISMRCIDFLYKSNLRMGVFDFKLDEQGEIVFFENNPQGQFMFLQGITGFDIRHRFCEFLCDEIDAKGS